MSKKNVVTIALTISSIIPSFSPAKVPDPSPVPGKSSHEIGDCFKSPIELLDPYRVGPGDELTITSYNFPEIDSVVTVEQEGKITFPLLGVVEVNNLTVEEIDDLLTGLLNRNYLYFPELAVSISDYKSRKVYLLGDANNPGTYFLETTTRVLDLLGKVGMIHSEEEFYGDKKITILRNVCASNGNRTNADGAENDTKELTLNLRDVLLSTDRALNIVLQDEDVVFISKTDAYTYFVVGEVKSPGIYPMKENLTVYDAITRAGGFSKSASKSVRFIRTIDGEKRNVKAKKNDLVRSGDIIEAKVSLF